MQYNHTQYFNVPGFVCLLSHSNIFGKTSIHENPNEETLVPHLELSQHHKAYCRGGVITLMFDESLTASVCKLQMNRMFVLNNLTNNSFMTTDTMWVSIKPHQHNFMMVKSTQDTIEHFKVSRICLFQKHTQDKFKSGKIEKSKTYLCAYSNNNVWINPTPNKYTTDGGSTSMDCPLDGVFVTELPKYTYNVDLNDDQYNIVVTFNLDFEDAEQDPTEVTINISF